MSDLEVPGGPVRNGIDCMIADEFYALRNMGVGLVTNHSGVTLDGRTTIEAIVESEELHLVKIFTPEHGLAGEVSDGEPIADSVDAATGIPRRQPASPLDIPRPDGQHRLVASTDNPPTTASMDTLA